MLSAISYNQGWHCDINMILWSAELCALHFNRRVSWLIIAQSLEGRVSKNSFLQVRQQDTKFTFDETDVMNIGISKEIWDKLMREQCIFERCETYGLDGTKVSIKTLQKLEDDSWEWVILTVAGIELSQQKWLRQEDEQGLVEWIFEWITDTERRIVEEILNP